MLTVERNFGKIYIKKRKEIVMANYVVSGDYKGKLVTSDGETVSIVLTFNRKKQVFLNKDNVEICRVVSKNSDPSFSSILFRSTIGGALFGEVGELLGAFTANVNNTYEIEVIFRDGKRCVIEIEERVFNVFVKIFS